MFGRLTKEQDYNLIMGIYMLCIPLILIIYNGEVRPSISDYVYASPLLFASLLTIGATSFFRRGYVKRTSNWFDMIIGVSLLFVAWTPHLDFPIPHYISAGVFFFGNMFNMVYFTDEKSKVRNYILAAFVGVGLIGYPLSAYSLLFAEWIGMIPMAFNYISEGLGYSK